MHKMTLSVPARHLHAIGEITVTFALLELALAWLTWKLLCVSRQTGEAVTCEVPFRGLVAMVSSLYRQRVKEPSAIKLCDRLLARATQVEEERNAVVHSLWVSRGTASTVVRFKATAKKRLGLRYQSEQVSVDKLKAIASEAALVARDLVDLGEGSAMSSPAKSEPTVNDA